MQLLSVRLTDEMMAELRAAAKEELRAYSNLAVLYIQEGLERRKKAKAARSAKTAKTVRRKADEEE